MESKIKNTAIKVVLLLLCVPMFLLGDYLLNDYSTRYEVFLGSTFHIILGCALMASSVVYVLFIIKRFFFPKRKKRKHSKPVFLKNDEEKVTLK